MRLPSRTYRPIRRRNLWISAKRIWNWVRNCERLLRSIMCCCFLHCIKYYISASVFAGDEDEDNKETKQEYTLLCDWVKQQLGDKVAKVQISKRLSSSPCVLVSGKFGWSANMERLAYFSVHRILFLGKITCHGS
jgi:hypothetical protein